jgi:hypothetical protein
MLLCHLLQALTGRPIKRFGKVKIREVFALARILSVEHLLQAHNVGSLLGSLCNTV